MHIFVCVDDRLGMTFGGRRQSRDRTIIDDILKSAEGGLVISEFSADLFPPESVTVLPEDRFPAEVPPGSFCFVENIAPSLFSEQIESVTLYRWNRRYPADLYFDLPVSDPPWRRPVQESFSGYSHPEITKEVYVK